MMRQVLRLKNAAKVSPQTAVTGNINQTAHQNFKKASNTKVFHVDTAMGLRHAFSSKKSMIDCGFFCDQYHPVFVFYHIDYVYEPCVKPLEALCAGFDGRGK